MEPNKVPFEYCHRWLACSLKIGERNYTLFLVCGLVMCLCVGIVSVIPYFGNLVGPVLSFYFYLGTMRLVQQVIKEPGAKTDFDTFMKFVFDTTYLKRFQIPILILAGLGALGLSSHFIHLSGVILVLSAVIYLGTHLLTLAAFMAIQNPSMNWQKAFDKVFQGFVLNLGAWFCAGLLIAVFALISTILCLVPFFLYFVPMTFCVGYLIYASIFDNLDIEALIKEWSTKTQIQTHTLPPEA